MRFEWDEAKRPINLEKHGIDFVDCPMVFESPMLVTLDSRKDYGEVRCIGIGILDGRIVTLVWTVRGDAFRLISARKAHAKERATYRAGP